MEIDSTPGNVAIAQLRSIPFGDLIGAPLNAAIKAQGQAAISTYEFIRSAGLQLNPATKMLEAIPVGFSFQTAEGESRTLILPLLAIVPIPLLVIDDLNISFKANISAESSTKESALDSSSLSAGASGSLEYRFVKANFTASYSSKKDSTATANSRYSVEYTMDVNVHASQAGMPAGLATMLQILSSSARTVQSSGQIKLLSDPPTQLKAGGSSDSVNILVMDAMNRGVAGVAPSLNSLTSNVSLQPTFTPSRTDPTGKTAVVLKYANSVPVSGAVFQFVVPGTTYSSQTFTIDLAQG